jgi:hypothetical protein
MSRIIIMGNEEELFPLATVINKNYCKGAADVVLYNDDNIGEKTSTDTLFLVGHASAKGIGDYDFASLKKDFGDHLKGADVVYLSGCSTKDEAAQVLKGGFIPLTLASNIKAFTTKPVYGTPGALVLTAGDVLYVEVTVGSGYKATDIFVPAK